MRRCVSKHALDLLGKGVYIDRSRMPVITFARRLDLLDYGEGKTTKHPKSKKIEVEAGT